VVREKRQARRHPEEFRRALVPADPAVAHRCLASAETAASHKAGRVAASPHLPFDPADVEMLGHNQLVVADLAVPYRWLGRAEAAMPRSQQIRACGNTPRVNFAGH
jgi:hypothetical protein